jgi:hypothetical protein
MRNSILLLIFGAILVTNFSFAQKCGTYEGSLEERIKKYPDFYQSLESKNAELKMEHEQALHKMKSVKTVYGKRIIPVVVHVIYDDIGDNLSIDEIQTGLDALNRNINGQDDNFLDVLPSGSPVTPDIFAAVRGDLNVEFRLAKIDPFDNPTTGIVRVKSDLAYLTVTETLSRDRVKALSYWNSYQYLNIWAVRSMPANSVTGDPGLNGYAQFPFPSPNRGDFMSTDGIVIRSGELKSPQSTTLVHEVGHWLNLRHTWGDSPCGDDNIKDTPPDSEGEFDFNLFDDTFPYRVGDIGIGSGCLADSLNWAGEMYNNYMDYQNDVLGSMFTIGQNAAMNEILEGTYNEETNQSGIGYRQYMCSQENIAATGTADGYKPEDCTSREVYIWTNDATSMCEFESITLKSNKTDFENISSFVWDMGDGTIITDDINIAHSYSEPNSYDVSLTIEYDEIMELRASDFNSLPLGADSYDTEVVDHMLQGTYNELMNMGANNITEIQIDSMGVYYGMQDSSFFRGYIEKLIHIASYTNTCVSSVTKEDFITVGSSIASSDASSYSYSFESASDLNEDWVLGQLTNIDNQWSFNTANNTTWKWQSGIASSGSSSIKINGEDMIVGTSTEIVSKAFDLSDFTSPAIKFSWSGAAVNTFPENELIVEYSRNCGEDWTTLGTVTALEAANAGLYSGSFKPTNSEWDNIVMTSSALKRSNIKFKFTYVINAGSNNFYLDDIQIGEEASLIVDEVNASSKLSLFPNPAEGDLTIVLEGIANNDIEVTVVNILGAEVSKLFTGEVVSKYQEIFTDLSLFDKGIYFVKVLSNGDVLMTDKLIVK